MNAEPIALTDDQLTTLRPLQRLFPALDSTLAEIARLNAELSLPMGTVHVLSDIHGDDVKLRHVINNASGMLRPLVKRLFASRLREDDIRNLLALLFYPRETLQMMEAELTDPDARQTYCRRALSDLFYMVNVLSRRHSLRRAQEVVPADFRELFGELLREPGSERGPRYYDALLDPLVRNDRALHLLRLTVRVVRNLAVDELVIGGDCWDRGPRGDRVVDYLMRQPRLSFVWGNHDAAWLGAALGHDALVAHVLRISLRYRRLAQLQEGYGIPFTPLEELARKVYGDDPATCFIPRGQSQHDSLLLARMQKAAAIMQFKLEGQMIARNPHWGLDDRRLLHTIDREAGTIVIQGKTYPLKDRHLPTLDPNAPYDLSPDEQACLDELRGSFLASQKLWAHMSYLLQHGSMWLRRDDNLVFHGCVPVDDQGNFLSLEVDGRPCAGKGLFDALDRVLARILDDSLTGLPETPIQTQIADRDMCWYLWCGPRSPLFGKDKIATLEIDLVDNHDVQAETKNPYFSLIHDVGFCDRILAEFGVDPKRGLIVNGHVPVKIEKGESPMKRSGKAITIDGAFSQAYGDHGYTLVLEPNRTLLATHHHFDSVESAVREGKDIIPSVSVIRAQEPHRTIGDTERGAELRRQIGLLEMLVRAYREKKLRQGEY
ncbi:MAG: fructose-bisphosphatase class III [Gemmataceae bacterium]